MTQFIIGLIAGGISGTILMAACAASGRDNECRECRDEKITIKPYDCGYIAYLPKYDCYGDGDTPQEALKDVLEVADDLEAIAKEMESGGDI